MRILVPVLSFLFSGLQFVTTLLVSPLSLFCGVGLLLFTMTIAWRVRAQARRARMSPEALPLAGDWLEA